MKRSKACKSPSYLILTGAKGKRRNKSAIVSLILVPAVTNSSPTPVLPMWSHQMEQLACCIRHQCQSQNNFSWNLRQRQNSWAPPAFSSWLAFSPSEIRSVINVLPPFLLPSVDACVETLLPGFVSLVSLSLFSISFFLTSFLNF